MRKVFARRMPPTALIMAIIFFTINAFGENENPCLNNRSDGWGDKPEILYRDGNASLAICGFPIKQKKKVLWNEVEIIHTKPSLEKESLFKADLNHYFQILKKRAGKIVLTKVIKKNNTWVAGDRVTFNCKLGGCKKLD